MKIERRDSTKKTKKSRIHANTFHRSNNMTQFNSAVNGKEKKYGQKRQKDKTKDKRTKRKKPKDKGKKIWPKRQIRILKEACYQSVSDHPISG